jgi:coenzyme F420-0:L-glutamate ligase / coenzyme F420-1:gamma-L-glutamate ligase
VKIDVEGVPNIPRISKGDNVGEVITLSVAKSNFKVKDGDVICVVSKVFAAPDNKKLSTPEIKYPYL